MTNLKKKQAILELLIADAFWGFGFVATVWGLKELSPMQFLFLRFLFSWIFGEIFYFLFTPKNERASFLSEIKISLPAGLLLSLVLLLQTIGLKYTTATQSGFITTLYVILVPLFQFFLFQKKQPISVFIYAFIALVGTYLLTGGNFVQINQGDLWTLACAIMAAFHIIYIGVASPKSKNALRFNTTQSMICFIFISFLMLIEKQSPQVPQMGLTWAGVMMTVFGSTLIGFTIQVRIQKVLSAATASMLFLLESPFAFIFGYLFLSERLNLIQTIGGFVILIASFLTVRSERI